MQWAWMLGMRPDVKNKTISVVSETMPHLRRGAMKDFFDFLNANNLYFRKQHDMSHSTYRLGNNNRIEFFSLESAERVHGPSRDYLFANEIQNLKYETFFHLCQRTNIQVYADYNPTHDFCIFPKYLDLPDMADEIEYIHSTIFDNPFASDHIKKDVLRRSKYDENYRRVYLLGEKGSLEGLIFPNITIIPTMPEGLPYTYGLDFGFFPASTAIVKIIIQGDNLYIDEILYKTDLTARDMIRMLPGLGIRTMSDMIWADGARPEIIEEIKRAKYRVKAASKGPGSVTYGIDIMKRYKIHVTQRSVDTIREFRNYQWLKSSDGGYTGVPMDAFNDAIDAVRYGMEQVKKPTSTGRVITY